MEFFSMNLSLRLLASMLVVFLLVPLVATARDDERRGEREGGEYKEKFRDGNCKVAREWKEGKFKEERECEEKDERQNYPSRAATVRSAPVMVYPPWVLYEQGRPVYRPGREPQPVSNQGAVYCNSETVGRVIGGVAGAVLGNQVGRGDGRTLATLGGAVAGVLIGGNIGRQIDVNNQACIAKALEFAPMGQRIEWPSAANPQYAVVPGKVQQRGGQYCRQYDAEILSNGAWQPVRGTACRRSDGVWVASN